MKGKREASLLWEIIAALPTSPVELVLCQLDALWRRKGRTLQADCPKHKMQSTATDCSLNQAGSGQRILDSTVFTQVDAGVLWIPFTALQRTSKMQVIKQHLSSLYKKNAAAETSPKSGAGSSCEDKEHWMLSVHTVTREEKSLPSASPLFPLTAHPADITLFKTQYVYAKISHNKTVSSSAWNFYKGKPKKPHPITTTKNKHRKKD